MIAIPLNIKPTGLDRCDNTQESIDQALSLLLMTPCYSSVADPHYGFIFNNLKFEIFNENEGMVYNSSSLSGIFEGPEGLYDKKITGTSKSLNTFAAEFRKTISEYEKRLSNIAVTMTYIREEQLIHVTVKGTITETGKDYQFKSTINVWK